MKKKPTKTKRKNVQDLTLKNLRAMKRRIELIEKAIQLNIGAVDLRFRENEEWIDKLIRSVGLLRDGE